MDDDIGEPFSFERVGGSDALDLPICIYEGMSDELIVDLGYTVHGLVYHSTAGGRIGLSSYHDLTVVHGDQCGDSGLGEFVVHGHVVGTPTILNLTGQGNGARDA